MTMMRKSPPKNSAALLRRSRRHASRQGPAPGPRCCSSASKNAAPSSVESSVAVSRGEEVDMEVLEAAGTDYLPRPLRTTVLLQLERREVPPVDRVDLQRRVVDPIRREERELLVAEDGDVGLLGHVLVELLPSRCVLLQLGRRDLAQRVDLRVDVRV